MVDFVLYSYQCNPKHIDIDPAKTMLTEFEEQENELADRNMVRHQELFQEFFDGKDEA